MTLSRTEQNVRKTRYGAFMEHDQGPAAVGTVSTLEHEGAKEGKRGGFHDRLNEAAGEISYRKLGRLTDTHPETVRRYMQGQAPSATFLTNLCRVMGISGEWLLTGRGPMKCSDVRSHALSQADPSELLTAVANTLTELCDRMDRLERYVQSIETRMNAGAVSARSDTTRPKAAKLIRATEPKVGASSATMDSGSVIGDGNHGEPAAGDGREPEGPKPSGTSAQRIRDAIAKRPS